MKVKLFDKELIHEYYKFLSAISTIASVVFLFGKIPEDMESYYFVALVVLLLIVFLALWFRANRLKRLSLKINNSVLEIEVGDIFEESDFKVIAFNEYYDTQVDDIIIRRGSINGQYILRNYPDVTVLDTLISADSHSSEYIVEECERKAGKSSKYKLGTIIKNEDFFLLAFSHFDKDNRAFLDINDYISCLMNMWNECDIHYGGQTVVLPLLGSGITRFHGYENITDQELLELIIWTFKVSRIRFQYPAKAKIVLTQNCMDKINLYDIKKRFK